MLGLRRRSSTIRRIAGAAIVLELVVAGIVVAQVWRSPGLEVNGQVETGMLLAEGASGGSTLASVTALRSIRIESVSPETIDKGLRVEGFQVLVYSRERHERNPAGCMMSISQNSAGTPFGYFLGGSAPVVPKGRSVELIAVYSVLPYNASRTMQIDGWRLTYRTEPWSPAQTVRLPKAAVDVLLDPDAMQRCDLDRLRPG